MFKNFTFLGPRKKVRKQTLNSASVKFSSQGIKNLLINDLFVMFFIICILL